MTTKADPAPFETVFVCTGNRARSVLAEALFRRYSTGVDATVRSVGTLEIGAAPPLPHAVDAGRRLGVDLGSHRAVALRAGSVASADLVVGFEPFHVAAAVIDGGAPRSRTFLLPEIVGLLELGVQSESLRTEGSESRARRAVEHADRARSAAGLLSPSLAIADPLGQAETVMQETAVRIDALVQALVAGLFGRSLSTD